MEKRQVMETVKTQEHAEAVQDAADKVNATLSDVSSRIENASAEAALNAEIMAEEAQKKANETLKSVERYVQEKPLQAAGIAFAAGILAAAFMRKK